MTPWKPKGLLKQMNKGLRRKEVICTLGFKGSLEDTNVENVEAAIYRMIERHGKYSAYENITKFRGIW